MEGTPGRSFHGVTRRRRRRQGRLAQRSLATREFAPGEPIDLTALVELDFDGTRSQFFVGPKNGGLEIEFHGNEVTVITPQSPLGENLMGKKPGQRWTAKVGGSNVKYHIVSVC